MPSPHFQVTRYAPGEEAALWKLYFDTTHIVIRRDYTAAQCERWAPGSKDMQEWSVHVQARNPFVVREEGQIPGFAELEENGHIDHFYVHHEWQRKGVGRALFDALTEEAERLQIPSLYTEASVTAMPFFVRMGFEITEEQERIICGSPAKRFLIGAGEALLLDRANPRWREHYFNAKFYVDAYFNTP